MELGAPHSDQHLQGGADGTAVVSQDLVAEVPDSFEVVQEQFDKMNLQ